MDCLEFRRRLLIDPLCRDRDLLDHEERCNECSAFARDLRRKEIRLRALMRSIEPRPSLRATVRKRIAGHAAHRTAPSHYGAAMAMAMLVAIAAAWWGLRIGTEPDPAQVVLQHIEQEALHLAPGPIVSRASLDQLFARFGASLSGDLGEVYFAAECLMSTDTGVHLVLQGDHGPVTMLMMPGEALGRGVAIESTDWHGWITPTPWGSIAVVGRAGERTDSWTQRLLDAVVWPHVGLPEKGLAAR